MNTDPEGRPEKKESDELLERAERSLAEDNEELKRLDEEIREAERKSKVVMPDPEP